MIAVLSAIYLCIAAATAWRFRRTETGRDDWLFVIKTGLLWPAVVGMLLLLAIARYRW